jgi:hypothetical protein
LKDLLGERRVGRAIAPDVGVMHAMRIESEASAWFSAVLRGG